MSTTRTPRSSPQKAAAKSAAPTAAAPPPPSQEESRRHSPLSASVLSATIHPAPSATSDSRRAPLDDTDSSEGERGVDWGIGSRQHQGARPPSSSEQKQRQASNGRSPSASPMQRGGRPVSYEALFAYEAREPDELGVAPGEVRFAQNRTAFSFSCHTYSYTHTALNITRIRMPTLMSQFFVYPHCLPCKPQFREPVALNRTVMMMISCRD